MEIKKTGKRHVRQIGFMVMPEDDKMIANVKSKHGLKTDADVIRYVLMLEDENTKLHEVLLSHKEEIEKNSQELKNMAWRQNAMYQLLLKVARANGVVEE